MPASQKHPLLPFLVAGAALTIDARADQVTLTPVRDNTIFQESLNSAGADQNIFAGRNSLGDLRRALIRFDASAIPPGSVVTEASLTLHLTMTNTFSGPREMNLHRLVADWGEGTSAGLGAGGLGGAPTPQSATWLHRFYDAEFWATAGGEFDPVESARTTVDGLGPYEWLSGPLAADVQAWVNTPLSNFGWMLLGDEAELGTAKRFASRDAATASLRPVLRVTFTPPCYANCDGSVSTPILNVDDFTCFINAFAAASAQPHQQQIGHYANCDNSTDAPVLNVDDFTCFINAFAAGCP